MRFPNQKCTCCHYEMNGRKWLDKVRRLRKEPLPDMASGEHDFTPDDDGTIVDAIDLEYDWIIATEFVSLPPRTLEQRLQEIRNASQAQIGRAADL